MQLLFWDYKKINNYYIPYSDTKIENNIKIFKTFFSFFFLISFIV